MITLSTLPTGSWAVVLSTLLLGACTQPAGSPLQAPKPVKIEVIGAVNPSEHAESFVGTLRARQRSDLGFETAGRLIAISVEVGDRVHAGQTLARLDESPARWRVDKAVADCQAAVATLAERSAQLQQQEMLAKDKIISATALQSARAAHQLARSQLDAAEASLATARRDLALTQITAPFDGEVVARLAQPHSDVASGQAIVQLQAGRALEVVAMLPDTVASSLSAGSLAKGRSETNTFPLVLEHLSTRSDNGSLVQAIFRVQTPTRDSSISALRSGGVVSVELPRTTAPASALTLPVTAVMPGAQSPQASVFVLNSQDALERRPVRTSGGMLPKGRVAIADGLNKGDRVVVAGTAFLHDGQQVAIHPTQTVLTGAQP